VSKFRTINKGDVLPASFVAALQEYLSTMAGGLSVTKQSNTVVQVVASTGNSQVTLGIGGLWRYNTATVTATHPGGAAGTYDILAVTAANNVSNTPTPDTDTTDYSFGLQIVASGGSASGTWHSAPISASRLIAQLTWSGTAITAINQLVGPTPGLIDDSRVAAGAAIAYAKLALTGSLVNADVSSSAAIALNKLATSGVLTATSATLTTLLLGTDVLIKRETAGVGAVRNTGDTAYADWKVANLTATAATVSGAAAVGSLTVGGASVTPPIGAIMDYAGASDPDATWLLCDGRPLSRTGTYAALFAVISTTYGAGDGSTSFNLPDFRGRVAVGPDNMGQGDAARLAANDTRGAAGGAETVTLTTAQIPSHQHDPGAHYLTDSGGTSGGPHWAYGTSSASGADIHIVDSPAVGGGGSHTNMQPFLVAAKIIKVK
jgi:microcystin-dependent protein